MMFSDEEIKESSLMRPGDEIISIREICLVDKYDKKYFSEPLLSNSNQNELEEPRLLRDNFFSEVLDQAKFAWTEEDGNIASFVSEPGFGTGQTAFGKDLDAALSSDIKDAESSTSYEISRNLVALQNKSRAPQPVSSTSNVPQSALNKPPGKNTHKIDKSDPRSRYHYVKYVKRNGRTVKLWECGICSREFQHQYTLMRHLPTHTDERNFHCDECSKSFRQLSTLSQHRAIHSTERPYACEVCNKTFNRVSTLISHRKTHSEEKPYKCHMCPKGFHQKGNLRNHLFTHTNERPYRCNVCLKGFNQQSNLVCHKNKAHPEDNDASTSKIRSTPRPPAQISIEVQTDFKRSTSEQCEVTSTVGPFDPPIDPTIWSKPLQWHIPNELNDWTEAQWCNGVLVDPIKTYHMGIALATKQTPFALLKSDNNTPILVKVVDTNMPGGKQMLVPATAEDLKIGGKIVSNSAPTIRQELTLEAPSEENNAVQIRVPVVATVVPKMKPDGKFQMSIEEPHHTYNIPSKTSSNMSSERLLTGSESSSIQCTSTASSSISLPLLEPLRRLQPFNHTNIQVDRPCSPPASSPLDLISLDLFEPIGCIPLGPQITPVDQIDQPQPSEDSDIFIQKFQEIIPLSDSE